jgi:hypothetical protein
MKMEIEVMRDQNHSYACMRMEETQVHIHECRMMLYNQVPCLLPVNIRYVDELVQVEYDLGGMQSLARIFEHQRFTAEQVCQLIRALWEAEELLMEYMLTSDGLVLSPEYIFAGTERQELRFCYQMGERKGVEDNVRVLLQYILDHVDYTDQKAVTLAYALYHLEDGGGDILKTMASYIKKAEMETKKASASEQDLEEKRFLEHAFVERPGNRRSFWNRLFHREGKRKLLLEQSEELAKQEEAGLARV